MSEIEPGKTYTAYRQGTNITPHSIQVYVLHVYQDTVFSTEKKEVL